MKKYVFMVAAALALSACDAPAPTPDPAVEAAAAKAAADKAAADKAAADAAAAAEAAKTAAAAAPMADEATWVSACTTAGVDAQICACAGKQTMATLGAKALYPWVWEGYVNRDGMAQMRSRKWMTDNGFDTAAQQKFADAVGTCYVTQ
jgi:colicin import membrane protein